MPKVYLTTEDGGKFEFSQEFLSVLELAARVIDRDLNDLDPFFDGIDMDDIDIIMDELVRAYEQVI